MEIDKLNRAIMRLKSEGYTYPTQYSYMQEAFDRIIVPSGVKNSGTIRTLEQVNNFLDKRFGEKAIHMTQEEYGQDINILSEKLKPIDTRAKFLKEKRAEYIDTINSNLGQLDSKVHNLPTSQLRDILNEAWRRTKLDADGSPTFVEHLMEIIEVET